jgi:hypothetical protein
MAQVGTSWAGVVVTLEHDEALLLTQTEDTAAPILALVGSLVAVGTALTASLAAATIGALGAAAKINSELIKRVDQGNGVFLTVPWPAIWFGQWWIVVPTPR